MKKLLLSLSVLLILGAPKLSAQVIPNADFNTWSKDALASNAKDPNTGNGSSGWWDFNMANSFLLGSSPVTVFQDSVNPTPYGGSRYCAKIVSAPMSATTYSIVSKYVAVPQTNGLLLTGLINISATPTIKEGIACSTKLGSFSFYYRYIPNVADTCSCTVLMYHYSSGKRNLIGKGYWDTAAKVSAWTQKTVNITYDSVNSTPDTVVIVFSACSLTSNPKANDTMNVGNMGYSVVAGVDNIGVPHDNVSLYPNPAQTEINLAVTGHYQANRVEVYDITGKAVGTYIISNNFLTINTQSYNSGLYLYKLLDNTGTQLNVGKFSVVK